MSVPANFSKYSDVNKLILEYADRTQKILGDKLLALYLSGSLSYGDFRYETSDIDFIAIVNSATTSAENDALEHLHHQLEEEFPYWHHRVEASYTPLELFSEILPPKAPRPWYGEGVLYREAPYGDEWIINNYVLYSHGIPLIGPKFDTLVPAISLDEVKKARVRDIFTEWEPKLRDEKWLANPHYQAYLILHLSRILATLLGGVVASKKASAAWMKKHYPEWKTLIEAGEAWQYGQEMPWTNQTKEFIRFAVRKADEYKANERLA